MNKVNKEFSDNFSKKVLSGFPIIFVQTYETTRCIQDSISTLHSINFENIITWTHSSGFETQNETCKDFFASEESFDESLKKIRELKNKKYVFVMRDLDIFIDARPEYAAYISDIVSDVTTKDLPVQIIVVSSKALIPAEIQRESAIVHFPLSTREEIKIIINSIASSYNYAFDKVALNKFADAFAGMAESEIKTLFYTIITSACAEKRIINDGDIDIIIKQKQDIVRKTGVIDLATADIRFDDVGGLKNLKKWIKDRKRIFEDPEEAKSNGLSELKGILLFGMPGTGKSLTSKMVANYYGMPLLCLNMGKIFSYKSPTAAITIALNMAEAIAPCVLWIDEVEKAFAGTGIGSDGGGGDIGRIFGILINWMQERKKPVFTVITSNDVSRLEPTIYRDGRIDEKFFVGFVKNSAEVKSILDVHFKMRLKKSYGKIVKPLDYDLIWRRMQQMIAKYKGKEYAGYAGANIEALVKNTLEERYFKGRQYVETKDVVAALNLTKPQHGRLIKIMGEKSEELDAMRA